MVAVEHGAALVPGHRHGHTLGHAQVDQVPDRCPPEVVAEAPGDPGLPARRQPRLPIVAAAPPQAARTTQVWKEVGDDPPGLPFDGADPLDLRREERFQLRSEVDEPPLVILRPAGIQPDRSGVKIELPTLEREDLALGPPPERLGDRRRHPEIGGHTDHSAPRRR